MVFTAIPPLTHLTLTDSRVNDRDLLSWICSMCFVFVIITRDYHLCSNVIFAIHRLAVF